MSIQNIGRNHWRVVVKTKQIDPQTGKRKYINRRFKGTKEEARAFEVKLGGNHKSFESNISFGLYIEEIWLPSLEVRAKTIKDYRYAINLLSGLSDERLSDLTAYSIEKAIHTLSVGDARSRAKRVLNIALNAAKRWGYIDRNPLDSARITIGANRHNKPIPYNARELDAVLSIFRGDIAEPTLLVLANCGLGKEEALALDWEDMDLDPDASLLSTQELDLGIIYIYKAWADDGDQIVEKATKNTHRERIVYVAGDALLRLRELKSGKSGPIWPGKVRSRVRPDAATRRFKLKVEKAGLRHIPLNNLRHTYATIALTKGLPLPVVSENLGHSQVSTTLRYTGASSALRMQSAVSFASFIDSQKQKNDKHNVKNG